MKKLVIIAMVLIMFSGCSLMPGSTPNPNKLKKSPCACEPFKEFEHA